MFCEKCGALNDDNAVTCSNCGANLKGNHNSSISDKTSNTPDISDKTAEQQVYNNSSADTNTQQQSTQQSQISTLESVNTDENFSNQTLKSENQPQQFRNSSQQFGNPPQQFGNGPQQFRNAPQQFGNGPQQFRNSSQQFGNPPQQFGNGPQQFGNGPQQFRNAPQQFRNAPQQFGNGPQQFGNGPQQIDNGPQQFGNGQYNSNSNYMKPRKPKKHFPLWLLILIIAVAVVIIGCLTFFFVAKNNSDPKNLVKKYTNAVVTSDYDTAFSLIDTKGLNITKDQFSEYVKDTYRQSSSKSTIIVSENSDSKSLKNHKHYSVLCKSSDYLIPVTINLTLNKQSEKQYLFFDTYKVSVADIMVRDYKIIAPKGAKVTIDDIDLSENEDDSEDVQDEYGSNMTAFEGDSIISGDHNIKVSYRFIDDIDTTQKIKDESVFVYDKLYIPSSDKKALQKECEEFVKDFYNYSYEGKDFSEISSKYKISDDSKLKDSYSKRIDNFKEDKYTSFTLGDFDFSYDHSDFSDSPIEYQVTFTLPYDYEMDDYKGNSSMYKTVTFIYSNGDWLLY